MSNNVMNRTAMMFTGIPNFPRWNGPFGKFFLLVKMLAANGMA